MATYKEIKGTQIEVVSSDPSNPVEGQVWYNSTDQAVKGQVLTAADAWATSGNLNTGRFYFAGSGIRESAIVTGGEPVAPKGSLSESYNGSTWTETNDLNTGRQAHAAAGSSNTDGIVFFGYAGPPGNLTATESWNGTSWTAVNSGIML